MRNRRLVVGAERRRSKWGLLHQTCHGENGQVPRAEAGQPRETLYLSEEEGAAEAGWWSPDPTEMQFGEGETVYLIDLLMGGSGAGEDKAEPTRTPAATSMVDHLAGGEGAVGQGAQPQEEFRKISRPRAKDPRRQQSGGRRRAMRGPPEGKTSPATGRERTRRTGEGQEGGAPGDLLAAKRKNH